jgi:hypothetical protein
LVADWACKGGGLPMLQAPRIKLQLTPISIFFMTAPWHPGYNEDWLTKSGVCINSHPVLARR